MTDDYSECDYSGLARIFCSHCQRHKLGDEVFGPTITSDNLFDARDEEDEHDYEVTRTFPAQFAGTCVLDRSHKIKRGTTVGRIQRADNPMLVIQGVACRACIAHLPKVD